MNSKYIKLLSFATCLFTFISSIVGVFYKTGGQRIIVKNIYNKSIELYGNGIYAFDSTFKATINKGTDLAILLVVSLFLVMTIFYDKSKKIRFLHTGLLLGIMYYSTCIAFGVIYNRLFLVYVLLFSSSFFLMILSLKNLILENNISYKLKNKKLKGTGIFIIVSGCSVLVWLTFILPSLLTGNPIDIIDIYTTEPTFILDLGIILPTCLFTGIMLIKQELIGYKLAPVLLTFMTVIGLVVLCQNFVQINEGIIIPIGQLLGLVISFVLIAIISIIFNIKILKQL